MRPRSLLVLLLAGTLLACGCAARGQAFRDMVVIPPKAEKPAAPIRDVYVLLLILDGGRADFMYEAIASGELPNFKHHVMDRGAYVENGVSVFPSVTSCGHQAFLTGMLAGKAQIPGLSWFDRGTGTMKRLMGWEGFFVSDQLMAVRKQDSTDDLFNRPRNIFDDLHGHGRAAIYEAFHMNIENRHPVLPNALHFVWWYTHGKYLSIDDDAAEAMLEQYRKPVEEIPRLVVGTFLGHDAVQHWYGTGSPEHWEAVRNEDAHFGRIVAAMKRAGIWDRTYIILTSDHGHHRASRSIDLRARLRELGLKPRMLVARRPNVAVSAAAISSSQIYLAPRGQWNDRVTFDELRRFPSKNPGKTVDVIDGLVNTPGIELVLASDGHDRVHIFSSGGGHAIINRREFAGSQWFSYLVPGTSVDPLNFEGEALVGAWVNDGRFHAADAWGLATRNTRYPDAPVMVHQIFDSDRAGDVIVTSRDGYHFRPGQSHYVQSHGGLSAEDIQVPLLIAGPDVKSEVIPFARITDVYPTLARIFGLPLAEHTDGVPLDTVLEFVPPEERVASRDAPPPTDEANEFFTRLVRLDELLSGGLVGAMPSRNGEAASVFNELKALDFKRFQSHFMAETARIKKRRAAVAKRRTELDSEIHQLEKSIRWRGRERYNDSLDNSRRALDRKREQAYILDHYLVQLSYQLDRARHMENIAQLLASAEDLEELVVMYVESETH